MELQAHGRSGREGFRATILGAGSVPFPADEGVRLVIGNVIGDNDGWGITLCGLHGIVPDVLFERVAGFGNVFARNGRGVVCPEDLESPEGFVTE